jgi:hypothetical protein
VRELREDDEGAMILLAGMVLVIAFLALVVAIGPTGRPFEAVSSPAPRHLLEEASAVEAVARAAGAAGCPAFTEQMHHVALLEAGRGFALTVASCAGPATVAVAISNGADAVRFTVSVA